MDESIEEEGNVSLTEEQLLRLRQEDPTQYSTLVKMHLSFTTDLPTVCDGVDGRRSAGGAGGGSSSWRQMAPLMRWLGNKRAPSPCQDEGETLTPQLIQQLLQIIRFLGVYNNVTTEGLFRKCGSSSRQAELRQQLLHQSPTALATALASCSPHDVASLLKGLLADLPEPLLQDQNFALHCKLAELGNNENEALSTAAATKTQCRRVKALQLLLLLLPPCHLQLLRPLLQLLHTVAAHKHLNRMTDANLGMVFAPHILCPRKLSGSELQQYSAVAGNAVAFMVKHSPKLFQVPVELECDVKQYWTNRAEAAMRQQLQQSICCGSFFQQHDSLDAAVQQNDTASITTTASSNLYPADSSICPQDSCHPCHDCSSVSSSLVLPDHDPTLAHTVFSFVDRAQTQAASARETTALALAELYAHVNSLPDSDKKRRLVKQFNAASGHGTPSYGSQGGGVATSRAAAFANSIKKHLLKAGTRRDAGSGLQKTAVAGGHLQAKKCGSYSPGRVFQQSMKQGGPPSLRHHPVTPSAVTPSAATPSAATPHQQRAKSWDNLTTPKNLRKCLFPSSPFVMRKRMCKEVQASTARVACSAKGSKSCTALCSRCSQRPLSNTPSTKPYQTCDIALQTSPMDRTHHSTLTSRSQDEDYTSLVTLDPLARLEKMPSADGPPPTAAVPSAGAPPPTAAAPPSTAVEPSTSAPPPTSAAPSPTAAAPPPTSAAPPPTAAVPPSCQESNRANRWTVNDPSLSSLCKRAEELIDISRSRTLRASLPPNNFDASGQNTTSGHLTQETTSDDLSHDTTSTAGSEVTLRSHNHCYPSHSQFSTGGVAGSNDECSSVQTSKGITDSSHVICPRLPRNSTFLPKAGGTPGVLPNCLMSEASSTGPSSVDSSTPVAVLRRPGLAVNPVSAHHLAQSPASPLTNAVLHDSISQALVLTPRSRCPIVATRTGLRAPPTTVARDKASPAQRHSLPATTTGCCLHDNEEVEVREDEQATLNLEASAGGAVVTGDGYLTSSACSVATNSPSLRHAQENIPAAYNIHNDGSVNTDQSKPSNLIRRKSTLSRKNASESDILEISRKSSFRKEEPKKSSSSKNVSSIGKAVRRSLSRRLSKSWRRSSKAGGLLTRQGGSSTLCSDQDTVDSGFDASNALIGSDDTSNHGDLSSQEIELESGTFCSSQRTQSTTGSESSLVPDFNRMRKEQTVFMQSSTENCFLFSNEPMRYQKKSPSPFSKTPPGVQDPRYSSSTTEALGSFFKHLSSSSLAEIAKRLKTYNDPALLNSSYHMLSPIESDTSMSSLPSSPVNKHDESLSLVFREYLESRVLLTGQDDDTVGDSVCDNKCRSDPLLDSCSTTSGTCSCSSAICTGGRSFSCDAINSLSTHSRDKLNVQTPLNTISNLSSLEMIGQEEEISESFHSVGGEFSESLLRCLDGQNPLSVSCDAASETWDAATDAIEKETVEVGVTAGYRAASYRSAVDLGELLSINRLCVTIPETENVDLDLDSHEKRWPGENKENSSPETVLNNKDTRKDYLTQNIKFDTDFIHSRGVKPAKNRSPLCVKEDESNVVSISGHQNTPSTMNFSENKISKLQDDRNVPLSSKPCLDKDLKDCSDYKAAPDTSCTPPRPSSDTRCQKVLGTKHGTPIKSLPSGTPSTKVHFETSL